MKVALMATVWLPSHITPSQLRVYIEDALAREPLNLPPECAEVTTLWTLHDAEPWWKGRREEVEARRKAAKPEGCYQ